MAWNRLRFARTTEALRATTTYMRGEPIVPTDGPDANRPFIGDGTTAGGRALAFREEAANTNLVGVIAAFPRATAPTGWVKANGATLSRSTYAALWAEAQASGNLAGSEAAKLPGQYGPGNGSTTFSIPDLRGEFIRGWDDGKGTDTGRAIGSSQADELKAHTHTYDRVTGGQPSGAGLQSATSTTANSSTPTGSTGGTETRPRNIALLFCIKY